MVLNGGEDVFVEKKGAVAKWKSSPYVVGKWEPELVDIYSCLPIHRVSGKACSKRLLWLACLGTRSRSDIRPPQAISCRHIPYPVAHSVHETSSL